MEFEEISIVSFIKEIKEVTSGAHPRKFCFVLGAGASRSSGIKSGQELVRIWDNDLRERNETDYLAWKKSYSITNENMYSFYSQYYEKRFSRCSTDGYNYIEKIMESAKPSAGYVMLAHLLTTTPHNVVITTNFDHLTEDAVTYYAQKTPLVIGHEFLAHYISSQPVRPTIIKIHRDLLFDPKSKSADLEKLPDSWKNALEVIFSNYHPIFIGYAGNDKSLMDFLIENSNKFMNDEWKFPYWLVYRSDVLDEKVDQFLNETKGIVIRHTGFDDVMIQLGAIFDYAIPKKEDFLDDAIARFKSLEDAIDAFSESSQKTKHTDNVLEDMSIEEKANNDTIQKQDDVNQAIDKITSLSERQRLFKEAIAYIDNKEYSKAIEITKSLIKIEPDNARYHQKHGEVLRLIGNYEEAILQYKKAIEIDPSNASIHFNYGLFLEDLEKYEEAIEEYTIAKAISPHDFLIILRLGILFNKIEQYENALEELEDAFELQPENKAILPFIASILSKLGRIDEAIERINSAIDYNPENGFYHNTLGSILEKSGETKAAIKSYKTAIKLEPENAFYYVSLANIFYNEEKYTEALTMIEKAISLKDNVSYYYTLLSLILVSLERFDEADEADKIAEELEKQENS